MKIAAVEREVRVRVTPGAIVVRSGRPWRGGEVLTTTPEDARRLVSRGSARRV